MNELLTGGGDIQAIIVGALVVFSVFLGALGIRSSNSRRGAIASAALAGIPDSADADLRSMEMSQSPSERILMPMVRMLTGIGRVFTPQANLAQWQRDLMMAGLLNQLSVTDFLGIRALVGTVLGIGSFFTLSTTGTTGFSAILFALVPFMIGLYLPIFWLKSKVTARQTAIRRAMPDALDMMSICVDAGLGFEAALQKVAWQWNNELTEEFRRVITEIRVGVSRVDALRHMVDRTSVPDIASFVAVLVQADQLGIAIKDVLHTQAEQMRIKRRQRAQESAQKAPLKMLFPLVFFIFPSMFAVILGPAVPKLMNAFSR